jgi:molybdopterin-guanine dinucleotide biosynthesis protein A
VYHRELAPGITAALEAGDYRVMDMVERSTAAGRLDCFDAERVAATGAWRSVVPTHQQFMNCNTPAELKVAARVLASTSML